MTNRAVPLMLCGLLAAATPLVAQGDLRRPYLERAGLEPCAAAGFEDALCGTHTVFENREHRAGRTIDLRVVVLPALGEPRQPDPIFAIAGGPGQAASDAVPGFVRALRQHRDIVLVDQRGTGGSNPLRCSAPTLGESINAMLTFDIHRPECADGLDADLTLYTTAIAMDDLDDVRRWLGYDAINLYGTSYGTRAAFVYMRRHGEHVRTATLRGVAPPALLVPERFALHSQRALDRLFADCAADEACTAAFPDPAGELERVLEALARDPADVEVELPGVETPITLRLDDRAFAGALLFTLYGSDFARMVPAAIYMARAGDFQAIGRFAAQFGTRLATGLNAGMALSVMCAEDAPFFDSAVVDRGRETFLGPTMAENIARACQTWPRGDVGDGYHDDLVSDLPVLMVSGDVDPVTPPAYAERAGRTLPNGLHVVIPNTGHLPTSPGCVEGLLQQFIREGAVDGLDPSCVQEIRRPAFVVP